MTRYAIYFLPDPASRLWAFGSSVLGYDATSGCQVPFPDHPIFREEDASEISSEPRRYGFHATLKAPFSLSDTQTEGDLAAALGSFASRRQRFALPKLRIERLGSFLALVPSSPVAGLDRLASDCVTTFEPFRAPVSDADRSRRLKSPLTSRQIELLDRWGYPYVLDEFRFHLTLTGPLDASRTKTTAAVLREIYAEIDEPVDVNAITLLRQSDRSEPFVVVRSYPLAT